MPLRSFDHHGTTWTVWDTHPATDVAAVGHVSVAAGYADGWLTFQSDAEKRRLIPVPGDWVHLSEDQLAMLLERAMPVRRAPDVRS